MTTMITTITLAASLSLSLGVEATAGPGVFQLAAKPGVFAPQASAGPGVFVIASHLETSTVKTAAVQG